MCCSVREGRKLKNGLMSILSVVAITLFIDMVFVMADPESMVEDMGLVTMFALPVISLFISVFAYILMRKVFPTGWLLMIPAVILSVISSFVAFVAFVPISGSSSSVTSDSHQFPNGTYKIGNIPFYLPDTIEKIIPVGLSVFAVDADNTEGWYLFLATDNKDKLKNYLIGFSEKRDPTQIQFVTVNQLWHQVQLQEKLSIDSTFSQIIGMPIADGDMSIFDEFAHTKIFYFQAASNVRYKVKIAIKDNKIVTSITQ